MEIKTSRRGDMLLWVAYVVIGRETFDAQGKTEEEAKNNLLKHLEGIIPIYEHKIVHATNILKDIRELLSDNFKGIPLLDAINDPDDRAQVKQIIEDVEKYGYQS